METVCNEGPALVLKLAEMGANFTKRRSGELHLTQEGGHSARRVVHAEDATGNLSISLCLKRHTTLGANHTPYKAPMYIELIKLNSLIDVDTS